MTGLEWEIFLQNISRACLLAVFSVNCTLMQHQSEYAVRNNKTLVNDYIKQTKNDEETYH